MVTYEFVDKNDFAVNLRGEGVGQGQERIFGIVLDRPDCCCSLFGRDALIMCYFL
jgi:hypothetical protein